MVEDGYKRKLTAILSADVKEYSRLMREDEEATIRTLTAYRGAMATLIGQHRGRVVDSPGDNLLAEFASVVDAVNCAVEIQRELAEQNAALPPERKMNFRIEDDMLCEQWQIAINGLKHCMSIFRNPEGSLEKKNEYIAVSDFDFQLFSPVK